MIIEIGKKKERKNLVDTICDAALLENSLTKKTGTGVVGSIIDEIKNGTYFNRAGGKNTPILFPGTSYHIVDLQDKPIDIQKFQSFDPNIRSTFGKFMLTYLSKGDKRIRHGRRLVIDQDLIRARIFFYDYRELKKIAERVPEVAWIVRNSTLTEDLIKLAVAHVGVPFVFTIDWVRYAKKIEETAAKENVDIDEKAFVTFRANTEVYVANKDKILAERRTLNEYSADITGLYANKPEDYDDEEE